MMWTAICAAAVTPSAGSIQSSCEAAGALPGALWVHSEQGVQLPGLGQLGLTNPGPAWPD
jgi:hypothetical protein